MKIDIWRLFSRLVAGLAILATLSPAAQEKTTPLPSKSAAVPIVVRVFDGDRFVSDLGLKDFEIDEAGMAVLP